MIDKSSVKRLLKKLPGIRTISNYIDYFYKADDELKRELLEFKDELNKRTVELNNIYKLSNRNIGNKSQLNGKDKIAVFTAIIGKYDYLHEPHFIENEYFDYYCFTDDKELKSDNWKIIYFDKKRYDETKDLDNTRVARYIKTHPEELLKEYKHSIWVDANVVFNKPKSEWLNKYLGKSSMLISIHPLRDCIYLEAKECIKVQKDDPTIIERQIEKYRLDNYPTFNGLVMSNVIYRKNDKETLAFDKMWWDEIKNYSKRDQLSFNYVVNKLDYIFDISPLNALNNEYYNTLSHCDYRQNKDI